MHTFPKAIIVRSKHAKNIQHQNLPKTFIQEMFLIDKAFLTFLAVQYAACLFVGGLTVS